MFVVATQEKRLVFIRGYEFEHEPELTSQFTIFAGSSPSSAASPKATNDESIKQARRRLSVMSDNKLVEGFETSVTLDEPEEVRSKFLARLYGLEVICSRAQLLII